MNDTRRSGAARAPTEVRLLLAPQIQFLRAAGVTLGQVNQVVQSEFRRRLYNRDIGRIEHVPVELANMCGTLIANWKTRPEFLNRDGYPRDLPLRSKPGFSQLSKLVAPNVAAPVLFNVLHRFGAIRKLPSGRIRLMSKVFTCTHPAGHLIAFEPNVAFLTDAAHVLQDQIGMSVSKRRRRTRYWREVENAEIPARFKGEFIAFSKRRVMVLMEEIEDWLDQHKVVNAAGSPEKLLRLGLGLFAIAEPASTKAARGVPQR